jgi:alpha-L-arabinofuranosidase
VWNIAGWDNTQHGLEVPGANEPYVRGRVESNRWYDIRIELQGANVKCYLDGKLIQQAINQPTRAIYAAGGRDLKRGEVVLAVVNVGAAQEGRVELAGGRTAKSSGKALVLTSTKVTDENSFEEPKRVIPREESFSVATSPFEYTFPEHSFTILRIPTR